MRFAGIVAQVSGVTGILCEATSGGGSAVWQGPEDQATIFKDRVFMQRARRTIDRSLS